MCISTSRRKYAFALVLFLGAIVLFSVQVSASPPPPDGYIFEQYGLSYDEASLISYLQNGLPKELVDKKGKQMDARQRWSFGYPEAVRLLAKAKSEAAVPILCDMLTALSPALAEDLEASMAPADKSDKKREHNLAFFQAGCVVALGEIGKNTAISALSGFAQRRLPNASEYEYAFREACVALALLGEEEGVALLMAALPDTPDKDPWVIIPLQMLTGVTFSPTYGPEYGQPARVGRALREKWLAWWEENRATYQADPEAIRERNSRYKPRPPMETIRDYVHEAPFRGPTDGPMERGEEAAAWLEKNGPKRLDDLAALMNDPDESVWIRREAMAWYAQLGGRKAIKEITRYVQNQVPFDPEDTDLRNQMGKAAFEIIKKHDLKKAYKLAKDSLEDNGRIPGFWAFDAVYQHDPEEAYRLAEKHLFSSDMHVSAASANQLMKHSLGWRLVIKNYDNLCPYAQRNVLQSFIAFDTPMAKSILSKALKSEDQDLRKTAEFIVKTRKLEGLLDEQ
jgi:hypothetical protein